jgi:phosphoenolpyruvate phosphomutase
LVAGKGRDETLRRMRLYADSGADAIILHSRASVPEEILDVLSEWNGACPVGLIPTTYPSLTEKAILSLKKVRFVIYANQMLRASVKVQTELLDEIRKVGGLQTISSRLVSVADLLELLGSGSKQHSARRGIRVNTARRAYDRH